MPKFANPSLSDLVLAYRQAKASVSAERAAIGLVDLAKYEASLRANLERLSDAMQDDAWFDQIAIGSPEVCPRGFEPDDTSPPPVETIEVGGSHDSKGTLSVRLMLMPTPDFAIAEVLYLWEFGPALETLLDDNCVGYRLRLLPDRRNMDRLHRGVYEYWPLAFQKYRDDPIKAARSILQSDKAVTILSTDVSSFFDSINPQYFLSQRFVTRLQHAARQKGIHLSSRRFRRATSSLLKQYADYADQSARKVGKTLSASSHGVPIGSLVRRVLANVALAGLDQEVAARRRVALYRRYVDDIVVVCTGKWKRASPIERVLPNVADDERGFTFLEPETEARYLLKTSKTRLHVLEGAAGLDFLRSIRHSFSAVTSERRAFWGNADKLASEFEELELFDDGHGERARLPRLRDADRYTLRHYMTSALVAGIRMAVLLLDENEGVRLLRRHSRKIISVLDASLDNDDFDLVLDLYRIALLAQGRTATTVQKELRTWLDTFVRDLSRRTHTVKWQGSRVRARPTIANARRYLRQRIQEARARSLGWPRRAPMESPQVLLRAADLRYLDRPADVQVHGHPPAATPRPLLSRREESSEVRRLRVMARVFLRWSRRARQKGWHGLDAQQLMFCARPPSYGEVAQLALAQLETERPSTRIGLAIDAVVDALRGTRYSRYPARKLEASWTSDVALLRIGEPAGDVRFALGSLPVDESACRAAAAGTPVHTLAGLSSLDHVLREARYAASRARRQERPTVLLLPELSLPRRWVTRLIDFAARERIAVIAGLEYQRSGAQIFNQAQGYFPVGHHAVATVTWTKRHPARVEERLLADTVPGIAFPGATPVRRRITVESELGRLGVLICSELLEARALSTLTGRVEALLVPAWNNDTWSFDHLAHSSASALVHAFVCVANNPEGSDSRIVAPIGKPRYERESCRLIQRGESRVVWADLPIAELAAVHRGEVPQGQRRYRPLPPDWLARLAADEL